MSIFLNPAEFNPTCRQIFEYIEKSQGVSPKELREEMSKSRVIIHRYLKQLLQAYLIEKWGRTPWIIYRKKTYGKRPWVEIMARRKLPPEVIPASILD